MVCGRGEGGEWYVDGGKSESDEWYVGAGGVTVVNGV